MRLYLVRHPQPDIASGVCYGSTDVRVTIKECAGVLKKISPLLPKDIILFSSPLKRCLDLAKRLVPTPAIDERLVEMNFGSWELRTWEDIGHDEVNAWSDNLTAYRPGGGESLMEMAARIRAFHTDIKQSGVKEAIVICHGGAMRMLMACEEESLADMALSSVHMSRKIGYGELVVMDC